ncbi:uncharacterized protein LOC130073415 [Rhinichthys klamathensis goyatoka]|uniref:uncharacterized protein LOC130073415 n=1 Tax=Rhinichthys klamathensis goyatoka TaxID=3034132 RepID=UPI0024B48607|nr:uncharacterized protein LOC130073415 [Rhinichthys klamathensis goyatoka]
MKEDEKVGTSIQEQLRDLKARCGETLKDECGGAPLGAHADELDCEVVTRLMGALARRRDTPVPLDFLRGFNKATFFRHLTPGGLDPAEASDFICKAMSLGSREQGVISLGVSLCDLIGECENPSKRNQVPDTCKFLRDSAREIQEGQQKLKEQLDAMNEIIQKLFRMKRIIKDLGGYSLSMTENGQRIMAYIMGTCTDNRVVSWLQVLSNQTEFVNLLRYFLERLDHILPDLSLPSGGHIHIVFVGHGSIVDQFMPSAVLVPTPNIIDTILYSPWNCAIDANAAYAIAQGSIRVTDREFYNNSKTAYYEPIPLPDRWNSMRASLHNIPGILLAPLTPEEGAWALFHQFWMNRSMEIEDRVIIPYLVPQCLVNAFGKIPLYMFIFATSFLLMLSNKTATVHLAACLVRDGSTPRPVEWRTQYAYTSDGTWMSVNMDNRNMNTDLYRALRSLFDRNRR